MSRELSVWAPRAQRVEVAIGSDRLAMRRGPDGWWRRAAPLSPGDRYGFCLDGGPPRPDPRSASQPDGVHGLSAIVDHDSFLWTDCAWRGLSPRGAVLYELHIGTFSAQGTFDGAIEHLGHLAALGVDGVELLPVAEFAGRRGWGYDGVDLYAPHHAYGGPEGLKRFVDACHGVGLGVVLDVVYNHVGPAGNYLAEFGPYFSDRHQTNWGDAVNYDGTLSHEVRRFAVDNAVAWLRDYHIDGLRLDAVHAMVDDSACHILEELARDVDALATHLHRPLFLIAESDLNDPRFVRSRDAGGFGLDSAWADEWHHALHATLTGERAGYYEDFGSLGTLAKAIRQAWVYDGVWSPHRQRRHGRSTTGLTGHQFVVCTQNHDQVGNRAVGDRSSDLLTTGRLRVAAAILLASPFTPMLFQGEEWGAATPFQYFTDHEDAALAQAVSRGRRDEFSKFGWNPDDVPDPQAASTFERSKLDWSELGRAPHDSLLAWYRELIALRRRTPALSDPRLDSIAVDVDDDSSCLIVHRGAVQVLVNLGTGEHCFPAPRTAVMLAASHPAIRHETDRITVPPDAVAIVETGIA